MTEQSSQPESQVYLFFFNVASDSVHKQSLIISVQEKSITIAPQFYEMFKFWAWLADHVSQGARARRLQMTASVGSDCS